VVRAPVLWSVGRGIRPRECLGLRVCMHSHASNLRSLDDDERAGADSDGQIGRAAAVGAPEYVDYSPALDDTVLVRVALPLTRKTLLNY
jgi:hypothetical protein